MLSRCAHLPSLLCASRGSPPRFASFTQGPHRSTRLRRASPSCRWSSTLRRHLWRRASAAGATFRRRQRPLVASRRPPTSSRLSMPRGPRPRGRCPTLSLRSGAATSVPGRFEGECWPEGVMRAPSCKSLSSSTGSLVFAGEARWLTCVGVLLSLYLRHVAFLLVRSCDSLLRHLISWSHAALCMQCLCFSGGR